MHQPANTFRRTYESAAIAEASGFDTATIGQHHFMPGRYAWLGSDRRQVERDGLPSSASERSSMGESEEIAAMLRLFGAEVIPAVAT